MINLNGSRLVRLILLSIIGLLIQGCASQSQNKSKSSVSLKNLYDQILETKLASLKQVEAIVGKLTIYDQGKPFSSYAGSNFVIQDGATIHASDVRVRTTNTDDIVKVILDIDSNKCLKINKIAEEYGPSVMLVKTASDHTLLTPSGIAFYSTIINDLGYSNFGFDSKACLKSMTFYTGKPYKGRPS